MNRRQAIVFQAELVGVAKVAVCKSVTLQQVINFKYSKPEVDVWAMAASLYFMLTGCVPRDFKGKDPWQTVLQTNAVPIRQRDASIPKKLADVMDCALIDNPQIVIKTAAELKNALESAL